LFFLIVLLLTVLLVVLDKYDVPSDAKNGISNLFQKKTVKINFCDTTSSLVRYNELGYQWEKVTCNANFSPRDGAGALVFNDTMWLIGGWNPYDNANFPKICSNDVWKSENGVIWQLVKANTFGTSSFDSVNDWEGRHGAGFLTYNGKMWIIGGDFNQGHYQNDIWNSVDGKNWTKVLDKAPWSPRVFYTTAVFNDKMWVFGGQTTDDVDDYKQQYFADAWSTENGVEWEHHLASNNHWLPRGLIVGHAVFQNKLWMLGGATASTQKRIVKNYYNDVWSTDNGNTWQCEVLQAPWEQRCYQNVAVWDNKLWVIGGGNGQFNEAWNRNDVWYSKNGLDWEELPNTPWESRHASGVFVYKNALWLVGGNNMAADVWRLVKIN